HTLIVLAYPVSHDLNSSNRPVRTRMPGGVAGARPIMIAPYADPVFCSGCPVSVLIQGRA
ncbi:MAG: hypothetical protein ACSLEZ_03140, partial [Thiobacillus sp.]